MKALSSRREVTSRISTDGPWESSGREGGDIEPLGFPPSREFDTFRFVVPRIVQDLALPKCSPVIANCFAREVGAMKSLRKDRCIHCRRTVQNGDQSREQGPSAVSGDTGGIFGDPTVIGLKSLRTDKTLEQTGAVCYVSERQSVFLRRENARSTRTHHIRVS